MNDKLARVTLASPLLWLIRGWRDFLRHPLPVLLHGLSVSLFGALLYAVAGQQFWLLVGAFSGFLLGLLVVVPLLGHASWHAYRDLSASAATAVKGG